MHRGVFRFGFFVLFSFLFLLCAPEKKDIQDVDLVRVLDRFAQSRVQTGLYSTDKKPMPSDKDLFEEACRIYRLSLSESKLALKQKNKDLYESIYGKDDEAP